MNNGLEKFLYDFDLSDSPRNFIFWRNLDLGTAKYSLRYLCGTFKMSLCRILEKTKMLAEPVLRYRKIEFAVVAVPFRLRFRQISRAIH